MICISGLRTLASRSIGASELTDASINKTLARKEMSAQPHEQIGAIVTGETRVTTSSFTFGMPRKVNGSMINM